MLDNVKIIIFIYIYLVFVVVMLNILIPLFFLINNKTIQENKLIPILGETMISIYIV